MCDMGGISPKVGGATGTVAPPAIAPGGTSADQFALPATPDNPKLAGGGAVGGASGFAEIMQSLQALVAQLQTMLGAQGVSAGGPSQLPTQFPGQVPTQLGPPVGDAVTIAGSGDVAETEQIAQKNLVNAFTTVYGVNASSSPSRPVVDPAPALSASDATALLASFQSGINGLPATLSASGRALIQGLHDKLATVPGGLTQRTTSDITEILAHAQKGETGPGIMNVYISAATKTGKYNAAGGDAMNFLARLAGARDARIADISLALANYTNATGASNNAAVAKINSEADANVHLAQAAAAISQVTDRMTQAQADRVKAAGQLFSADGSVPAFDAAIAAIVAEASA